MTLRVALLGTGNIAARHAAAVDGVAGLALVAACGRRLESAGAFGAKFGAAAFTDFDRMLDEARPDLLIVALPPDAHEGQVERAAAAGVHLLVEKPIALTLDRGRSMVAASGAVVAACGFMYRFGAAVERWDALAASGQTGRAGHFSASYHCNSLHSHWWRERARSGGQMVEQVIHLVDLMRHSLGSPDTVYARAANLFHRKVDRYDSEDVSAMIFGYRDGRIGVLHASNAAVPGRWLKGWQIVAEHATGIFADWNRAEIVTTGDPVDSVSIAAATDPFVAQLENLRDAILNRRSPRVPLADGLASLELVLAARRSADESREVALR